MVSLKIFSVNCQESLSGFVSPPFSRYEQPSLNNRAPAARLIIWIECVEPQFPAFEF
jgi:hypothetical protein